MKLWKKDAKGTVTLFNHYLPIKHHNNEPQDGAKRKTILIGCSASSVPLSLIAGHGGLAGDYMCNVSMR